MESGLGRHYGTDASLDATAAQAVTAWLLAHAASSGEPPPDDRLTLSRWFQREHREVAAATWRHAAVRTAANCGACHTQAAAGSYRESEIRLPH